jgi:hypothetical protein
MNKVVYNACYGGFSLSREAMEWLVAHGADTDGSLSDELKRDKGPFSESFYPLIARHNPLLVQCVEELGEKAGGMCAELAIHTIEGNLYRITEYDGYETVEVPDSVDWITIV